LRSCGSTRWTSVGDPPRVSRAQRSAAEACCDGQSVEAAVRCRPGTVPVCDGPGSAVHHERTPAQRTNFDGFRTLALHRVRDTCLYLFRPSYVAAVIFCSRALSE